MSEIILNLPKKLRKNIEKNASLQRITPEALVTKLIERYVVSSEYIRDDIISKSLPDLADFINQLPGVDVLNSGSNTEYLWWIKFNIDIEHRLAWAIIQNLGFILNYISLTEHLPTVFMPVSPPPYLNGGPKYNLSWVIESSIPYLDPKYILEVLKERLPPDPHKEESWEIALDE